MARSRYNYLCVTTDGEVKKYAAQYLEQIFEETDNSLEYQAIIRQGLHQPHETDYVELKWYD